MQAITLISLAVLLAGCAAKIIDSNPRMVMVNAGSADPAGALKVANEACGKHGRYAVLNTKPREDRQWVFDCVQ
jgi:hypothetical protein